MTENKKLDGDAYCNYYKQQQQQQQRNNSNLTLHDMATSAAGLELVVAIQELDARLRKAIKRMRGEDENVDDGSRDNMKTSSCTMLNQEEKNEVIIVKKKNANNMMTSSSTIFPRTDRLPSINVKTALEILRAPDKRRLAKLSPTGILGTGADSVVLSTKNGVALKYSPPSADPRFSAKHEYNMLRCWAPAGLAFGPIDLINSPRNDSKKNDEIWKGPQGARFLATSSLKSPRLAQDACKEFVTVIAMEAAEGTLANYIASRTPLQDSRIVGAAIIHLLQATRRARAVHNDAKADNIGYRIGGPPLAKCNDCPMFRFVDCRNAITEDYLQSIAGIDDKSKLCAIIDAGCRRDALCLCGSLLLLADQRLTGDRALYAKKIASIVWPFGWKKTASLLAVNNMSSDVCAAEAQRLWRRIDVSLAIKDR